MPTEITFSGGHSIVVDERVEIVRRNIEETGMGRPLLRYQLSGKRDHAGNPAEIHINWGAIAYVREVAAPASAEPGRVRSGGETTFGGIRDKQL